MKKFFINVAIIGLFFNGTLLIAADIVVVSGTLTAVTKQYQQVVNVGSALTGSAALVTSDDSWAQVRIDDHTLITLLPNSRLQLSTQSEIDFILDLGGVDILTEKLRIIQAGSSLLKVTGYLKLRNCVDNCPESPGIYAHTLTGEMIVEHPEGRSIFSKQKIFINANSGEPKSLTGEINYPFTNSAQLKKATLAKAVLAEHIKLGIQAFKNEDFKKADHLLMKVVSQSQTESIVYYYLGLIALELKDKNRAIDYLNYFSKLDQQEARNRNVTQLLTLLLTDQLQTEVKQALKQESEISTEPPEKGTIAVQPFTNRGDPGYKPLAKGIAAFIINDLSKVPGLKVLERQKVQKMLDEISLNQTGLVADSSKVRAGLLMRAEKVVVGNFGVEQ
ncbi:MAG: hypothetical protein HQL48_08120 [Gammaproteobacteria bacterium]|nr:hypothetical protein [Gammaproteobacteria bacterium]